MRNKKSLIISESEKRRILEMHLTQIDKELGFDRLLRENLFKNKLNINEDASTVVDDKTKKPKEDVDSLVTQVREKYKDVLTEYAIWEPILEWFSKNKKNRSTIPSLKTLLGETTQKDKFYELAKTKQSELLTTINSIYTPLPETDTKKVSLENLYKLIKSFDDEGVVLKGNPNNNYYNNLSTFLTNISKQDGTKIDKFRKDLTLKYKSEGTGSYELNPTVKDEQGNESVNYDEVKRLLNNLTIQVNKELNSRIKKVLKFKTPTIESVVRAADGITFAPGKIQINSSEFTKPKKGETTLQYVDFNYQYPPLDKSEEERRIMAINFMGDDEINVSDDKDAGQAIIAGIRTMMDEIIKAQNLTVNSNGEKGQGFKITYINVHAYASTSCVRTAYKVGFFDKENNKQLALDRAENMISYGVSRWERNAKERLKNVPGANKIAKMKPITKPNMGPDWMEVGGEFPNGEKVTINNYGPLFIDAYKKSGNKLTPQEFYGPKKNEFIKDKKKRKWDDKEGKWIYPKNANYNPEIAKEYEQVYSPFRQSLFSIEVGAEMNIQSQPPGAETTFVATYSSNFTATIYWNPPWKPDLDWGRGLTFRRRPKKPGLYPMFTCTTCCPSFR